MNQYIIYINNPEDDMYPIQHYYVKSASSKLDALKQLDNDSYSHWFGLNNFVVNYHSNVRNYIRDPNLLNLYMRVTEGSNVFGSGYPHEQKYIERFINEKRNDYFQLISNEEFLSVNPFFKILLIPNMPSENVTFLE